MDSKESAAEPAREEAILEFFMVEQKPRMPPAIVDRFR